MPTALITGITGQDGSHLAEFLLSEGYTVVGDTGKWLIEAYQQIRLRLKTLDDKFKE